MQTKYFLIAIFITFTIIGCANTISSSKKHSRRLLIRSAHIYLIWGVLILLWMKILQNQPMRGLHTIFAVRSVRWISIKIRQNTSNMLPFLQKKL